MKEEEFGNHIQPYLLSPLLAFWLLLLFVDGLGPNDLHYKNKMNISILLQSETPHITSIIIVIMRKSALDIAFII